MSIYSFDISSEVTITSSLDINVSKPVEVSLETYLDNTIGAIKCGNCFGEIMALGRVIGTLDLNRKQSFSYRDDESWKYLYSKRSQCLFSRDESDRSTWKIQFVVDEVCVATAFVATNSIINNPGSLRASCVWTWASLQSFFLILPLMQYPHCPGFWKVPKPTKSQAKSPMLQPVSSTEACRKQGGVIIIYIPERYINECVGENIVWFFDGFEFEQKKVIKDKGSDNIKKEKRHKSQRQVNLSNLSSSSRSTTITTCS